MPGTCVAFTNDYACFLQSCKVTLNGSMNYRQNHRHLLTGNKAVRFYQFIYFLLSFSQLNLRHTYDTTYDITCDIVSDIVSDIHHLHELSTLHCHLYAATEVPFCSYTTI